MNTKTILSLSLAALLAGLTTPARAEDGEKPHDEQRESGHDRRKRLQAPPAPEHCETDRPGPQKNFPPSHSAENRESLLAFAKEFIPEALTLIEEINPRQIKAPTILPPLPPKT